MNKHLIHQEDAVKLLENRIAEEEGGKKNVMVFFKQKN